MGLEVLGPDGFEERVAAMGRAAVCFTADWCPFCRRFEPQFQAAAARHPGLAFAVADVSEDDTDPRWDRYAIQVVPTVLLFREGEPVARLDGILGRGLAPGPLEAALAAWERAAR